MRIEHLAIWTKDIEKMRVFYETYFNAVSNKKYINNKKFESYFLSFNEGCRLEIMRIPEILDNINNLNNYVGLAHFAISVGSKEKVISLTERLRNDNYIVLSEPRTTGDGYFESVVCDPDNNKIEITI